MQTQNTEARNVHTFVSQTILAIGCFILGAVATHWFWC